MNKERLLRLADHLETVKEEEFDFTKFWCGTSGCALGHACSIPEFAAAGLRLGTADNEIDIGICFENEVGIEAAVYFFEVSRAQATRLFMPYGSGLGDQATAKQVSAHIRKFVEENS